jgi:hypothetical protein
MLMGEFELLNYQSTWDYRSGVATYTPPTGFLTNTGTLTTFAPNLWPIVYDAVVDGVDGNIVFCGDLQWAGTKFAMGMIAIDIPAPPPIFTPRKPTIDYLLRKVNTTLFRWDRVFFDSTNHRTTVDGYKVYRSTNENLESYELIMTITSKDIKGFVDSFFSEDIVGYYGYGVSAFNVAGESEMATTSAVSSSVDLDLI